MKRLDLSGKRFGKLLIERPAATIGPETNWWAICECGVKTVVRTVSVMHRGVSSCGCDSFLGKEKAQCSRKMQERFYKQFHSGELIKKRVKRGK